jgi:putative transposase
MERTKSVLIEALLLGALAAPALAQSPAPESPSAEAPSMAAPSPETSQAPESPTPKHPDGEKELLAVEDGYRESAESWKTVLRDLKRGGMVAPVLAVGDGALGFWAAAREVWPETREQGCWCHKLSNVLDKLPQRLQPRQTRAARDDVLRTAVGLRGRQNALRSGISGQISQGGGVAHRPLGAPRQLLRLPGGALEAPAHHQRNRVAVRHRALARARDQGRGLEDQGTVDGVQAARHGPAAMAAPSMAPGCCRSSLPG